MSFGLPALIYEPADCCCPGASRPFCNSGADCAEPEGLCPHHRFFGFFGFFGFFAFLAVFLAGAAFLGPLSFSAL